MITVEKILYITSFRPGDSSTGMAIKYIVNFKTRAGKPSNISKFNNDISINKIDIESIKNKKIYISKSCTIPQFKREKFQEQYGVNFIRDITKADYCVVGNKIIDKDIDFIGHSILYKAEDIVDLLNNACKSEDLLPAHREILRIINDENLKHVAFYRYGNCDIDDQISLSYGKSITRPEIVTTSFHITDNPEILIQFSNLGLLNKIIDQSVILKNINSVVINHEQYEMLANLFSSHDEANTSLAMETMANSDYEKSAGYILKLLYYYKHRMFHHKSRHHVNFKSMLNYFGIGNFNYSAGDISNVLIEKNLLSLRNIQILHDVIFSASWVRDKYYDIEFVCNNEVHEKIDTNEYKDNTDSFVIDYSNVELLELNDYD